MKGVILSIAPGAALVDLTHEISPQDVFGAALTLQRAYRYFPQGTIFLVVVDPGVGTERMMLAAQSDQYFFVGPDNGFISLAARDEREAGRPLAYFSLDRSEYWLPEVSRVFHGRDIFAPVAAHLARGLRLEMLGTPIQDPVQLDIPQPEVCDFGWRGKVIHVDHFGNLAINLREIHLAGLGPVRLVVGSRVIDRISRTYGDGQTGDLAALFDSAGYLSISVVNGNAQAVLNISLGDPVEVYLLKDD